MIELVLTWDMAWQASLILIMVVTTLSKLGVAALNFSGRFRRWWSARWLPSIKEADRDSKIDALLEQMQTNGGHTLRDKVNEIGKLLESHITQAAEERQMLLDHIADSRKHMNDEFIVDPERNSD